MALLDWQEGQNAAQRALGAENFETTTKWCCPRKQALER
jgi:hypothetical protein